MQIGTWDVDGMLDDMVAQDLIGWLEFAEVEPFGDARADLRSALAAAGICSRLQTKGQVRLDEFLPKFRRAAPTQKALGNKLKFMMGAFNQYHGGNSKS